MKSLDELTPVHQPPSKVGGAQFTIAALLVGLTLLGCALALMLVLPARFWLLLVALLGISLGMLVVLLILLLLIVLPPYALFLLLATMRRRWRLVRLRPQE